MQLGMMAAVNKTNFGGRQMVTSFNSHRGSDRPQTTRNLTTLCGAPPSDDPNDVFAAANGSDVLFERSLDRRNEPADRGRF